MIEGKEQKVLTFSKICLKNSFLRCRSYRRTAFLRIDIRIGIFLTGYTAYTVYAVYYYRTFANALSIVLLVLIGIAFGLSAFITFTSYRINLKDRPRPLVLRFIK